MNLGGPINTAPVSALKNMMRLIANLGRSYKDFFYFMGVGDAPSQLFDADVEGPCHEKGPLFICKKTTE